MHPSRLISRLSVAVVATALLAPLSLLSATEASAAPTAAHAFTYAGTVAAGKTARSIVFDRSADAIRLPVDNGTGGADTSGLASIDAATFTASDNTTPVSGEPSIVRLNPSRPLAYIAHYRSGILTVVDTVTNTVLKTIQGIPKFPSTMEYDEKSDTIFIADDTVTPVNIGTGVVGAPIVITTEKYPLLKDMVLDPSGRTLWISEGRAEVVTAIDITTLSWKKDVAVPITTFTIPGTAKAGRPNHLALDARHNSLYVTVDPKLGETWKNSKLVTVNTNTLQVIGTAVDLGDTTREVAVDPLSSEIYATNGNDNTLTVVSPETWSISDTVDFNAAGVTQGTGTGWSNVWGIAIDANRRALYVSHPYTSSSASVDGSSAVSKIVRTGATPTFAERAAAPGQGAETPTTPQPNAPFAGPAPAALTAAPAGAVVTSGNALRWSVSEYAQGWKATPYGVAKVESGNVLTFTGGKGWTVAKTGQTQISWPDAVEYRQYPGLAPDVFTTFANPVLSVQADGSGTLTFDVAWGESKTTLSDGFRRVTVATFARNTVAVKDGVVRASATPDFFGRSYVKPGGQDTTVYPNSYPKDFVDYLTDGIRGWWLTTGASASGNAMKVPSVFTANFVRTTDAAGPVVTDPIPDPDPTDPAPSPTPVPPTERPTTAPTPVTAADPTAVPVAAGSRGDSPARLAFTGSEVTPLVLLGGGLLLVGGLALARVRARRLRAEADQEN